jgi:chitinase
MFKLIVVMFATASVDAAATVAPTDKIPWPDHVFSPYVDVTLWPTPKIDQLAKASGAKHFTLAFLVADSAGGKSACWGGYATYPVAGQSASDAESDFNANLITGINNLRAAGGDVIISFGGANGTPIDSRFTDIKELTAEYQRVIDTYHLKAIDLDIEGSWSADAKSIARRSAAIKSLQAANPNLKVWFTLAVLPTGLTDDGLTILKSALDAGVRIDGVNIMAMDYGDGAAPSPKGRMAAYAIAAAGAVHDQLKTLFAQKRVKSTDAVIWSAIGVTPMIGINDTQTEVFDPPAAKQLLAFADQKKLGLLCFWSLTRDHPGKGSVTATDSGLPEEDFAFSAILSGFEKSERTDHALGSGKR